MKKQILTVGILMIFIITLGCIEEEESFHDSSFYPTSTPTPTYSETAISTRSETAVNEKAIFEEAGYFADQCMLEWDVSNDMMARGWGTDDPENTYITDQNTFRGMVNQYQREDTICIISIEYLVENRNILDGGTPAGWATESIEVLIDRIRSHNKWYREEASNVLGPITPSEIPSTITPTSTSQPSITSTPIQSSTTTPTDAEWWEKNTFTGNWYPPLALAYNIPTCTAMLDQLAQEMPYACTKYDPMIIKGHVLVAEKCCMSAYEGAPYLDPNIRQQELNQLQTTFDELEDSLDILAEVC